MPLQVLQCFVFSPQSFRLSSHTVDRVISFDHPNELLFGKYVRFSKLKYSLVSAFGHLHKDNRSFFLSIGNRWRRHRIPEAFREEIVPKNILMIGPTGCGKTEIARRLAKIAYAPFVKVFSSGDSYVLSIRTNCTCTSEIN